MMKGILSVIAMVTVFSALGFLPSVSASSSYGPSWEEHCSGGTCTRTLYSGVVYADSKGTPIEDVASLKHDAEWDVWDVIYLEVDPDFVVEVTDFNTTSISMSLNFTGNWSDYPEYCNEMKDGAKCKFKTEIKQKEWNDTMGDFNEVEIEHEYEFELEDNVSTEKQEFRYYENPLGKSFKFGGNSTTFTLQDAGTENLRDTYVDKYFNTANSGSLTYTRVAGVDGSDDDQRTYIMFNLNALPDEITILEAELCIYVSQVNLGTPDVYIHHIYSHDWKSDVDDTPLTETSITWNNQVCGTAFDNSTYCNLTGEDTQTVSGTGYKCWNTTYSTKSEYDNNDQNVSYVLRENDDPSGSGNERFTGDTKEGTNKPQLSVTYNPIGFPYWYDNSSSTPATYSPTTYSSFNISWNSTNTSYSTISTVFLEGNWSGSSVNYTIDNDTYGDDIYNYSTIIGAGDFYWYSCANDTYDQWNCTDIYYFSIAKRSNPVHTNITIDSAQYTDQSKTNFSNVVISVGGYLDYSDGGTAELYISGISYTNPTSQTWGVGTYTIKVNTSGNTNYTSNVSGSSVTLTIVSPPLGGGDTGGGGGSSFIVYGPDCGDYRATPADFSGASEPGTEMGMFILKIRNGADEQSFDATLSDNLREFCGFDGDTHLELLPNSEGQFKFQCEAPNGTISGYIEFRSSTGCVDSRPVVISGGLGTWADISYSVMLLGVGDIGGLFNEVEIYEDFSVPFGALIIMIFLIIVGVVMWIQS